MSRAGRPKGRHLEAVSTPNKMIEQRLLWLEIFGHGLVFIIILGLIAGGIASWLPIIVYIALQAVVMMVDSFETWHAWPFIVRDWRKSRRFG